MAKASAVNEAKIAMAAAFVILYTDALVISNLTLPEGSRTDQPTR